jgi:hypothetical protein
VLVVVSSIIPVISSRNIARVPRCTFP